MANKGHIPWNKGLKGFMAGDKNGRWKGDKVSYAGIHQWIRKNLGKPMVCSECKITTAKMYNWANISGKYKRDFKDWKRLCGKCHWQFDYYLHPIGERNGLSKLTKKDVIYIRKNYIPIKFSLNKLAKKFNVSHPTIRSVVKRKTWRHI